MQLSRVSNPQKTEPTQMDSGCYLEIKSPSNQQNTLKEPIGPWNRPSFSWGCGHWTLLMCTLWSQWSDMERFEAGSKEHAESSTGQVRGIPSAL